MDFRVQIRAYGYYENFEISCEDNSESFENTLVDKLGKNDIIWEKDGFTNKSKVWITYEEVNNANAHKGPIQSEEGSRDRVGSPAA